jgi:tryptophan-rich sensory protein
MNESWMNESDYSSTPQPIQFSKVVLQLIHYFRVAACLDLDISKMFRSMPHPFLVVAALLLGNTSLKNQSLAYQPSPKSLVVRRPTCSWLPKQSQSQKQYDDEAVTRKQTQLSAALLPPTAWWAVGHVVGGALATPLVVQATKTWYRNIDLPSWTPPNRVFAPVWTTLYSCMGVAAGKIYYSRPVSKLPMILWSLHCALNLLWAPMFFGLQRLRLGFLISLGQIVSLAIILPVFYQIQPLSAVLLLPYLSWLMFASYLNQAICKRNPTTHGYNNAMLQADLCQLQRDAAKYAGVE